MKFIYFFIIVISSILLADISVVKLFTLGGMNIHILDIIYTVFILAFLRFIFKKEYSTLNDSGGLFLLFLFSILFFIGVGFVHFGYRAFGEGRYFLWLFGFFLPFLLFPLTNKIEIEQILKVVEITIYLSAILGVILFIAEVIYGGRIFLSQPNKELIKLSDFRGVRYLGSEETYNIVVLLLFLTIKILVTKKVKIFNVLLIVMLTAIVAITKNRAAPVALIVAFLIYLLLKGNIKQIIFLITLCLMSLWILSLIVPQIVESILFAFEGVLNIREDTTGSWRYFVQLSAIEQGLERPYFGIGFGGHFQYYAPELGGKIIELPPHNAFVHLFSKTGIFPVLLALLSIIKFSVESFKLSNKTRGDENLSVFYVLVFVIAFSQIFYGLAYGFSIYFGLIMGFFTNISCRMAINQNKKIL